MRRLSFALLALCLACAETDGDGDGFDAAADCDDGNAEIYPDAVERCNDVDDDCDGDIDEDAQDAQRYYADLDGDGYAGDEQTTMACALPAAHGYAPEDCDDGEPTVYLGADELCDGLDNDCDGAVPDDEVDGDGDGVLSCGDCDDGDDAIHPDATEQCDEVDNDCDGETDEEGDLWPDEDDDGYGDPDEAPQRGACDAPPPGWASNDDDCDDGRPDVNPAAQEVCDTADLDEDCDGLRDDEDDSVDRSGALVYYRDADGDRYGDEGDPGARFCDQPDGYARNNRDCNDATSAAHGGITTETCGDGIDNNCDGTPLGCHPYDTFDLSEADARILGEAAGDQLGDSGRSIAGAGDIDGDGYDDVIVGALFNDGAGEDAGAAYVVLGPFNGDVGAAAADARLYGEQAGDLAGGGVGGLGDVNSDGYDDVVVGAIEVDDAHSDGGAAYVFFGPLEGELSMGSADAQLDGEASLNYVGRAVTGAGDVNGDGVADLLIGAEENNRNATDAGAAYLVLGEPGASVNLGSAHARLYGSDDDGEAGHAVAAAGDVNGDGYDDVLIGAYLEDKGNINTGAAYVFFGPVSGAADMSAADLELRGAAAGDDAGRSVAGVGDLDGDGLDDLLVGAPRANANGTDSGAAFLVSGRGAGTVVLSNATATLSGEDDYDWAGIGVDAAGDVDGDGTPDLLVGAHENDDNGEDAGSAYLVLGPVSGSVSLADADGRWRGATAGERAGWRVAGAGDTNRDGMDDLLVAAPRNDEAGVDAGAVYLVLGATGL